MHSFSFFGKAEVCDMVSEKADLHACCKNKKATSSNDEYRNYNQCCSNELIHLELDNEIEFSAQLEIADQMLDTQFKVLKQLVSAYPSSNQKIRLHNADPPSLKKDVSVLYQVFRI
jgi:hypothetical protein